MTGTSKRRALAAILWVAAGVLAPVVEAGQINLQVPSPARGIASVLTWSDRSTGRLDLTIDGRVVASCPSWRCVYKWQTGAAPDGTYSVTSTRYDAQLKATDSTTKSVTVRNDRTRPIVTLSVPGAIASTAIVSASAEDRSEIKSLAVYLDGTPVKTVAADVVAFSWDSTSVTNGRHTFYAKATDASGNTGQSTSISVTVMNSASPPGSETPPGGSTATGVRLALVGTPATGPYSVQAIPGTGLTASFVHFDVDGHYLLTDTQAPFYLFRDDAGSPKLNVLGPGSHPVRAQVYDAAGTKIADATLPVWEGPPPPAAALSPIFPSNNIWNTPVDAAPLHALNAQWMDVINGHAGHNLHPDFGTTYQDRYNGIPLNIIEGSRVPRARVTLTAYASESDPIPAGGLPIPQDVLIEGDPGPFDPGADNHCLILDTDTHTLHEFYWLKRNGDGTYTAKQYSRWDYTSNALRPDGWTSADAAGLPLAPGLVRYDEVLVAVASGGVVPHAFRFTLDLTWTPRLWPARHDAPSGVPLNPPMGMRVRLKANYDISGYSPVNQAILRTLKRYGMILSDNGGDWFLNGVPDSRWNPDDLALLQYVIPHDAFEVVDVSGYIVSPDSGEANAP